MKLSSIPPPLRRKSDWYRPTMDAMIDNDTREVHCQLSSSDSLSLLEYLFPDALLLPIAKGKLSATQSSMQQPKQNHFTMSAVLEQCRAQNLYGLKPQNEDRKRKRSKEMWLAGCPNLDPKASPQREVQLTIFFNNVLTAISEACDTVRPM